ncbi:ABC transporter substrate-binding protein [uncultured Aeromicrobium sp.]|uniref:ABC transporter substrate-binding protein n=1 Tax=uncultured Aeromicrobium sp. TaxID=337820 RepID=UPI0025EBF51C|nr:extracellular solute-binding protein [uncultured Aeromicrobium sp.]
MFNLRRGRRLAVAATPLAVGALLLSACSSGDSDDAGPDVDEGGTLTIANYQFLEPGRGDALWEALSGYATENDAVTLERSETPFAQYADKLNTELGSGGGPDVFVIQDAQFATLAEAGLLEPLDDVLEDADLNSTNEDLVVDGEQLAVTWEQVAYALMGNKNVMEQAGIEELPTTVDELISAGQAVQQTGAAGLGVRHQMNEFDGWYLDFNAWTYGNGGSWSDGEELTIDSPENIAGVEQYQQVIDSGIVPVGDDASTFRTKFKENQLGFIIDNSGAALSFTSGGAITGADIVSGPLPFDEPGQHQKIVLAVNANSEVKELAKDFVRWFVSEEGQQAIRPPLGASTLATDVPLTEEFSQEHPWAQTFIDINPDTKSTLIEGFETDTKAIMQTVMQAVERAITQGADPAEVLEQAQQDASAN